MKPLLFETNREPGMDERRAGIQAAFKGDKAFRYQPPVAKAGSIGVRLHSVAGGALVIEHCGPAPTPEPPTEEGRIIL